MCKVPVLIPDILTETGHTYAVPISDCWGFISAGNENCMPTSGDEECFDVLASSSSFSHTLPHF